MNPLDYESWRESNVPMNRDNGPEEEDEDDEFDPDIDAKPLEPEVAEEIEED